MGIIKSAGVPNWESVPEAQAEWAESHASTIAGEVLATSVEVVVGQELTHDVGDGCTADVAKVQ